MTDGRQELDVILDKMGYTKNTDFRKHAIRLITDWHNKQVKNAVATAEDDLDQYWNKELDKQIKGAEARLFDRLTLGMNSDNYRRFKRKYDNWKRNKLKETK